MRTNSLTIGTMGLAGLVTMGILAFPVTSAFAGDDSRDSHDSQTAFKRDDDTPAVTLVADDDDDDTNARGGHTNTNTNTGRHTRTRTNTRHSRDRDHSHGRQVRDHTSDGPGRGNVDHSRRHTNDRSRHNTRG